MTHERDYQNVPRLSWSEYGLAIARITSLRSEDPYRRVGAAVFRSDWSIISTGYNGAPPGIEIDWSDRTHRRDVVIHAEMNALRYASRDQTMHGYLCTTHQPCDKCLPMIAAYGLAVIFYYEPYVGPFHSSSELEKLAAELGLTIQQAT